MNADPAAVATLVRELLTERGPLTEEKLYDALVAAEAPMGAEPERFFDRLTLWDDLGPVVILNDGRYSWLPAVLRGRIFTHRVDERELEHDVLMATPNLDLLSFLIEGPGAFGLDDAPLPMIFDGDDLPDGRAIPEQAISEGGDFLLPAGTLSGLGVKPDDLIGLRVGMDRLTLETIVDVAAPPPTMPAALLSQLDDDAFESIGTVVATLCASDEEIFRHPLPPIEEILDIMGFARYGDRIAVPGFDFEAAFLAKRVRLLQERRGLAEDAATAVVHLVSLFHDVQDLSERIAEGDEPDRAALEEPDASTSADETEAIHDVAQYLSDPDVVSVVLDETLYAGDGDPASLIALTGGLEPQAPREARAPLRWLQAKAYEHLGDVETAERILDQAEGLAPDWPLTLLDLARYASDRGDAPRALGLLRRAGVEENSPFMTALLRYQPTSRPEMRRNAPCWCGSGRKYKACHLNKEQLPLAERAGWLYAKASEHLRTGRWPMRLIDCAEMRMRDDSDEAFIDALFDPFVTDVLLVEGSGFQDFFLRRRGLLPADERELAEQWLGLKRSVFQIVDVRPGQGVTLESVATNDRYEVEHREGRDLRTGALVCGRLLPVEGIFHCFGGLEPLPNGSFETVLGAMVEQDPEALIEAVSH